MRSYWYITCARIISIVEQVERTRFGMFSFSFRDFERCVFLCVCVGDADNRTGVWKCVDGWIDGWLVSFSSFCSKVVDWLGGMLGCLHKNIIHGLHKKCSRYTTTTTMTTRTTRTTTTPGTVGACQPIARPVDATRVYVVSCTHANVFMHATQRCKYISFL